MASTDSTPLPRNVKTLLGFQFGRLTVMAFAGLNKQGSATWLCQCTCGNTKVISGNNLKKGDIKSCRCLQKELARIRHTTHGMLHTQVYKKWRSMIQRCYNQNNIGYKNYGGRGIIVCERWRNSFVHFLEDIGEPPTTAHTIERLDNNGPYSAENCCWATNDVQQRNTRATHFLTLHGQTMTLTDWSRVIGIHPITLCARLRRG